MRRVLLAFLVIWGVGAAHPSLGQTPPALDSRQEDGLVVEDSRFIILKADNGRVARLIRNSECDVSREGSSVTDCVEHNYSGFDPVNRVSFVRRLLWEDEECVVFFHSVGIRRVIGECPSVSPNGQLYLVVRQTEIFGLSGMQVWRVSPAGMTLDFQLDIPRQHGFAFRRWESNVRAVIAWVEASENGGSAERERVLERESGGWVFR